MSRKTFSERAAAATRKRNQKQEQAHTDWQMRERIRERDEALAAKRKLDDDLVDKVFSDILNATLSDRVVVAAHEINPLGQLVSILIPLTTLRRAITIARERMGAAPTIKRMESVS